VCTPGTAPASLVPVANSLARTPVALPGARSSARVGEPALARPIAIAFRLVPTPAHRPPHHRCGRPRSEAVAITLTFPGATSDSTGTASRERLGRAARRVRDEIEPSRPQIPSWPMLRARLGQPSIDSRLSAAVERRLGDSAPQAPERRSAGECAHVDRRSLPATRGCFHVLDRNIGNVFVVGALDLVRQGGRLDPSGSRDAVPVLSLVDGKVRVIATASDLEAATVVMAAYVQAWGTSLKVAIRRGRSGGRAALRRARERPPQRDGGARAIALTGSGRAWGCTPAGYRRRLLLSYRGLIASPSAPTTS